MGLRRRGSRYGPRKGHSSEIVGSSFLFSCPAVYVAESEAIGVVGRAVRQVEVFGMVMLENVS